MKSDQKADMKAEFHKMWGSCVGQPKYDKRSWMDLEKVLMVALKFGDAAFAKETLLDAQVLQIHQLELN